MRGRPPWTPPGNGVWSATAACPERTIQTPVGDVQVQQPRVRDRRPADERETFRSAILPPYLRKTPSLEALYPWLYLQGHQHRRLRRGAPGVVGARGARVIGDDHHAAEGSVGARVPGLVEAVVGRTRATPTSGPTACTSTSGSRTRTTNGNAFWC